MIGSDAILADFGRWPLVDWPQSQITRYLFAAGVEYVHWSEIMGNGENQNLKMPTLARLRTCGAERAHLQKSQ